jgi:hypothetical protein
MYNLYQSLSVSKVKQTTQGINIVFSDIRMHLEFDGFQPVQDGMSHMVPCHEIRMGMVLMSLVGKNVCLASGIPHMG